MSNEKLLEHCIDAEEVEVCIRVPKREVEIHLDSNKEEKRYRLLFSDCVEINLQYAQDMRGEDSDLWGLSDGISELKSSSGWRTFRIVFDDYSVLSIHCHQFTMEQIIGYGVLN